MKAVFYRSVLKRVQNEYIRNVLQQDSWITYIETFVNANQYYSFIFLQSCIAYFNQFDCSNHISTLYVYNAIYLYIIYRNVLYVYISIGPICYTIRTNSWYSCGQKTHKRVKNSKKVSENSDFGLFFEFRHHLYLSFLSILIASHDSYQYSKRF